MSMHRQASAFGSWIDTGEPRLALENCGVANHACPADRSHGYDTVRLRYTLGEHGTGALLDFPFAPNHLGPKPLSKRDSIEPDVFRVWLLPIQFPEPLDLNG